jgi:hypothetical protein
LALTLPTSPRTNFLVAQAGAIATASTSTDIANVFFRMMFLSSIESNQTVPKLTLAFPASDLGFLPWALGLD